MLKINAPKDFLWFSQKMPYLKKQFSHIMKQLDIGMLEERRLQRKGKAKEMEMQDLDFEGRGERNLRHRYDLRTCPKKEEPGIYSKNLVQTH